GEVLDLLAGIELDIADPEWLARHDGLGEAVGILDELGRADDWRRLAGLPGAHCRLDLRVIWPDELAWRGSRLGLRGLGGGRGPDEIRVGRSRARRLGGAAGEQGEGGQHGRPSSRVA